MTTNASDRSNQHKKRKRDKAATGRGRDLNNPTLPAQIQADPCIYLRQCGEGGKKRPELALAALLGYHVVSPERQNEVIPQVQSNCPNLFSDKAALRKLLLSEAAAPVIKAIVHNKKRCKLLCQQASWDAELALLALGKTKLAYKCFPSSLKRNNVPLAIAVITSNSSENLGYSEKEALEKDAISECPLVFAEPTVFRNILKSNNDFFLHSVIYGDYKPQLLKVKWDQNLALEALEVSRDFYSLFPDSLKKDNKILALAALKDGKDKNGVLRPRVNTVSAVSSCCKSLFSDREALESIFGECSGNLILEVVERFTKDIPWDNDLAKLALDRSPATYTMIPSSILSTMNIQDEGEMLVSALINSNGGELTDQILDKISSSASHVLEDQILMEKLFQEADTLILYNVVKKMARKIVWKKALVVLARRSCLFEIRDDDEDDIADKGHPNLVNNELRRMFENVDHCCHIPIGVFLSRIVDDGLDCMWCKALSNCRCSMRGNHLALLDSLRFVEKDMVPGLIRNRCIDRRLLTWARDLARHLRTLLLNHKSFDAFLKSISVVGRHPGPVQDAFHGDEATSVGLKRTIAEFLGTGFSKAEYAAVTEDGWKLFYCLVSLPEEFEDITLTNAVDYNSPVRNGTFYLNWSCDAITKLNKKYISEVDVEDDECEDTDDEDEDYDVYEFVSDEYYESAW